MDALSGITALLCLGMAAQWLAWRLNMPSILLLLIFGFFAGPGWLDLGIAELFPADLLFPLISASVAIILFEGGLSLRMSELRSHGRIVLRLISVGAAVTWVLTALAARWLVGLPWDLALLLGAILVVSGPTVVLPLLRQVNPRGRVGPILKWEGIAIDPIGRVLAVTPNDEVNTLISLHFRHEFGRSETYQLAADTMPAKGRKPQDAKLGGRLLFSEAADYFYLTARRSRGRVRVTQLTEQFDYTAFRAHYGERAVPLGAISENGNLTIATVDQPLKPSSKARVVALVEDAQGEDAGSEAIPSPSERLHPSPPPAVQDDRAGPPPT